jgi:MSHA pilin protein MshA
MRCIITPCATLARNSGFTLIEGVVLASLVGIAAAFAVPRFTRLANNVRASEVITLGANLRSAAQAAHAQFLAPGAHLSAITLDGKIVTLRNGYPDVTASGIRNAIFDADGFTANESADSVIFIRADAPSGSNARSPIKRPRNPAAPQPLPIPTPAVARLRDSRIFILRVYAHIRSAYKVYGLIY